MQRFCARVTSASFAVLLAVGSGCATPPATTAIASSEPEPPRPVLAAPTPAPADPAPTLPPTATSAAPAPPPAPSAPPPAPSAPPPAPSAPSAPPAASHPLVGKKAPDLTLPRVGKPGERVSLSKLSGKVVVLHFFATYLPTGPRKGLKDLVAMGDKPAYATKLAVIGVAADLPDDAKKVNELATSAGPSAVAVHDADDKIRDAFQVERVPMTYIIDATGVIRFAHVGYAAKDLATIEAQVTELLR